MSLHQAHILPNNVVAELAIPINTHFPQPVPCAVSMFSYRCTPKKVIGGLIIINFISFKTYIHVHQRPKSMFKHGGIILENMR